MRPQTGFTGSALSMQTALVGGYLAQNGPQNWGNPPFWRFWPVFGPERGRETSLSPPDPLKLVNRELRPQEAEPSEGAVIQKLRNASAVPMSQKFPEKPRVAPSCGQNGFFCRLGP